MPVTAVKKTNKIANIRVSVSNTGQMIVTKPVEVKGLPPAERLDSLLDVDADSEVDGGVPVYNEDIDKYEVRQLSGDDIDLDEIDGGTF